MFSGGGHLIVSYDWYDNLYLYVAGLDQHSVGYCYKTGSSDLTPDRCHPSDIVLIQRASLTATRTCSGART